MDNEEFGMIISTYKEICDEEINLKLYYINSMEKITDVQREIIYDRVNQIDKEKKAYTDMLINDK
jgi:hypothetical protein